MSDPRRASPSGAGSPSNGFNASRAGGPANASAGTYASGGAAAALTMGGWAEELGLGGPAAGAAAGGAGATVGVGGQQQQQKQQQKQKQQQQQQQLHRQGTGLNGQRADRSSPPVPVLVDLGFDDVDPVAPGGGAITATDRTAGSAGSLPAAAAAVATTFHGGGGGGGARVERTSRSAERPRQGQALSMQTSLGPQQLRHPQQGWGGMERAASMGHAMTSEWNNGLPSSAAAPLSGSRRPEYGMRSATPPTGSIPPQPPPTQLPESASYVHKSPRPPAGAAPPPPRPGSFLGYGGLQQGVPHHHHPPPPPPPPPPPAPPAQQQQWIGHPPTSFQRLGPPFGPEPSPTTPMGGNFRQNRNAPQQQQLGVGSRRTFSSTPGVSSGVAWAQTGGVGVTGAAPAAAQQQSHRQTIAHPVPSPGGVGGGIEGRGLNGMGLIRSMSDPPLAGLGGGGVGAGSSTETQELGRNRAGRPTVAEERLRRRRLEGLEQQQQLLQHQEQEKLLQQFFAMGGGGNWDEGAARAARSTSSGPAGPGASPSGVADHSAGLSRRSCSGGALSALSEHPRPLSPSSSSAQGRASPTGGLGGRASLASRGGGGGSAAALGGGLPLSPTCSVHSGVGAGGISPLSSLSNSPATSPLRRADAAFARARRSLSPPPAAARAAATNGYGHSDAMTAAAAAAAAVSLGTGRSSPILHSPPRRATASYAGGGGVGGRGGGGVLPRKHTPPPRPERGAGAGGGRSESAPPRPRSWTGSRSSDAALAEMAAAAKAQAAGGSTSGSQLGILLPLDYSG